MSVFEEKNKHTTMCGLPRWAKSKEAEKINIVAEKTDKQSKDRLAE